MKASWDTKPLGEVCTFTRGLTYKKGDEDDTSSSIVLRANNIDLETNTLNFDELKRIKASIPIPESKKVSKGSLLICTASGSKTHLGKVALIDADYDYAFGGFMGQLTPTDSLYPKYFYYALTSESYKQFVSKLSDGANINNLKFSQLERFEISIPSIEEQQRIVSILDEAFAGIATATANAEKNLQNARELFESTLQSVFAEKGDGWVPKKLGDLTEVQSGGTPLRSVSDYWGGEVPWYSSGELNKLYTVESERKITQRGLDNSNAKLFTAGSLLIGMYDTAALKMSILDRDAAFNQAIAGAKPSEDIDLVFVMHAINANKENILNERRGVRQKNLSLGKIKDIVIPIPNIKEQRKVVSELATIRAEVDRLEDVYRKKQESLNELRQSILQKAFAGELH